MQLSYTLCGVALYIMSWIHTVKGIIKQLLHWPTCLVSLLKSQWLNWQRPVMRYKQVLNEPNHGLCINVSTGNIHTQVCKK